MKIAVVGAGISGLACAWRLAPHHEVTLYEAEPRLGGHSHTVDVTLDGVTAPVDTGFLVFNHRTYPELTRLFEQLAVPTHPSEMTFSVSLAGTDRDRLSGARETRLEWAGTNLNTVFAQRQNLVSPRFLGMLADLLRFNRLATAWAANGDDTHLTVGQFLEQHRFGTALRDWYLFPMAAAIWSCPTAQMAAFPMVTFARFCANHGLLQVANRPQWYTVYGGARVYVERLASALPSVRRAEPVVGVTRRAAGIDVETTLGTSRFDRVVFACHSDQSLRLLRDPSPEESELLGAVRYQNNHAVLHTDATLLPTRRRAWAAWNYECRLDAAASASQSVCVHYLINRLQPLPFRDPVIVSLNPLRAPDPRCIVREFDYAHPVFDSRAVEAVARLPRVQGQRGTWFAGAWTGYGFHEDGLKSGYHAAAGILAESATVPLAV